VDLGGGDDGQEILYVHTIHVGDAAAFRKEIKEKFERRMLQIRQDLEEN
jgi:multisubunit Na+/H+ antiporter MnhE subunit